MNRLSSIRLVATVAIALLSYSLGRADQAVFRATANVVTVPVSVTTSHGRPVADLTPTDLAVTDNSVPQAIEMLALEEVPLDVTIVLTTFPGDRSADHYRGVVGAQAVRDALRPTDRLRAVWIETVIRGSVLAPGEPLPLMPESPVGAVSLVDGLFYALTWPVRADRRHLVVAFTDGWDTSSTLELKRLPSLAGSADAVLHVVLWASPGDGKSGGGVVSGGGFGRVGTESGTAEALRHWAARSRVIEETARQTGGTVRRAQDSTSPLAAIIADFRSSYVLRYRPTGVALPGWHDIEVRMTRPGSFIVRARKGYDGG